MEKECIKCHRMFHTNQEDVDQCPDCLRGEFAPAARLDETEHEELVSEFRTADRRQRARAERLNEDYNYDNRFSMAGRFRFGLGIFLFAVCFFFILLLSSDMGVLARDRMDVNSLRVVALLVCSVGGLLVATASPRRRLLTWPMALVMVAAGWYMPEIRENAEKAKEKAVAEKVQELKEEAAAKAAMAKQEETRVLTNADLDVFFELKKTASPSVSQYAVFMNSQDARTREIVRDALTRLTEAEYTRAYTRAGGALYLIANAPGKMKNITPMLSRFGNITYSNPAEGIYELRFDAEKANLVSKYSGEVLSSPLNASFVSANIGELTSLDPMRVRTAANALRNANVQVLRREVHDALLRALNDPWSQDNDTYTALVGCLVQYSGKGDKETTTIARRFFELQRSMQKEVPQNITDYLVEEIPDAMVAPILECWMANPLAWDATMDRLGNRAQTTLLEKLKNASSVGEMNAILKYLKEHGNADAIPAVQEFADKADSNLLRRAAEETLNALRRR